MTPPDYAQAIAYALGRLAAELPAHFTYHNLGHTRDEVMPAAVRLARLSGLAEEAVCLVEVGAAYHDLGFVEAAEGHELIGARLAVQTLPAFGFSGRQIDQIMGLILATRLPQSPRTLPEEILADADLDVLGRADFFARSEALRQETAARGRPTTSHEWAAEQLRFLQQHHYFTPAARELRAAGKEKNLAALTG